MAKFPFRPPVVVATPPPPEPPAPAVNLEDLLEDEGAEEQFTLRWLYWKAILWLLLALGAQTLASLAPSYVESYYSQMIYFYIPRLLSRVNRFVGISLAEIFFGLVICWFVFWTIWYLRRVFRGETRFFDLIKVLVLHMVWTGSILFVFFKVMWGFNYQRMPLAEAVGFDQRLARSDELQMIANRIVNGVRNNYTASRQREEQGELGRRPPDVRELSQAIELSFKNTRLIGRAAEGEFTQPKPLKASQLTSIMGIRSFYLPYTGEVSYSADIPPSELPFALARAKAYQRGYAKEDEANFVAFLVCTTAADPYVRYSGYLHAVKVLELIERSGIGRYRDSIGPGPISDLEARRQYWDSMLSQYAYGATNAVFNAHLRVNRIPQGLQSADGDIQLIIFYYLSNPGLGVAAENTPAP